MSDSIGVQVGLGLVKSIVCVYDVITFPFYFFAQKPWEVKAKASEIQAKQNQPNNPYSAWARVNQPEPRFYDDCKTVSEFFSRVVKEYGDKKSFGTRQMFGEEDEKQPDGKVFRKFILGDYQWVSSYEVDKRIENFGKGLLTNGVHPRDNVLIFAETRFEWMLAAQAIFRIGATVATLYPTLGEDGIVHGINETEVTHIITTHDLLPKLQKLMDRIPLVRYIIYMEGFKSPKTNGFDPKVNVMSFSQIEKSGMNAGDVRGEPPQPNTTAVLMYTSGSTGIPKGVMITHKNLLKAITAFSVIKHVLSDKDVYMGFLPLAHVLELAAELFFFSCGVSIGYATPLTLTDKSTGIKKGCPGDAVLLKPTVMTAVPLVLDRIRKGVIEQVEQKGKFFSALFNFAIDYKKFWKRKGFKTPIVNALICKKIKAMLGGRVRVIAVGSAPLSPETHDFIAACLDITLLQGYGLTETTASACLMDYYDLSLGRVGPPLEGIQIKLTDWAEGGYRVTDKPYPRGEIVVGGENITAGYYKNDTLTKESYKEEDGIRWFYTGDIGEAHPDGSFKIIDRKKDLVKLQFGEYISLGKVEAELKSCSYVDNICIYGDSFRSYLIGLVVPNAKALKMLAEQLGKEHLSHNELCRDKQIISTITKSITEHGIKAKLHKNEIPTKIKICPEEWVPDTGLVTAAFKLRRKNIEDFYKLDIDRLYEVENGISKST